MSEQANADPANSRKLTLPFHANLRYGDDPGGEIMQIKLKVALAAAGFALATIPAFAVEMPTDGSKNFSTPTDAPSYFTNEAVPESARVANPATFTSEDVAAAPDVGQASEAATEPERHSKHASAHRSTRHASGKSKGHGGPTGYAKSTSSKATGTAALHSTAKITTGGSRSASTATAAGKSTTTAGATNKAGPTKHARTGSRQHVDAIPAGASPLTPA
jgi:hypothetical protein